MKTMVKLFLIAALLGVVSLVYGQDLVLPVSTTNPTIDGVVAPKEYPVNQAFGPITLSLSRSTGTLTLAVSAKTQGWIAVGLGSLKMDGATIFIGYVDKDGKVQFKPQVGAGHHHSDADQSVADSVVKYALTQNSGVTTLEVALKAAPYIKDGQSALDLIFAEGAEASFAPYHEYRNAVAVKLKN